MSTPILETERLILRPIDENDINDIFICWMQDEEVSRYMFWKASSNIEEVKKFIEFELGNIEDDSWNRFIIVKKETNEIIGTCLIFFNEEENNWDISYNLGKSFWGMGYITEAMKKVILYAKEVLKIKECIAPHAIENTASEKVIKKLGFKYIKDVPYEYNGGEIKTIGKYYKLKF